MATAADDECAIGAFRTLAPSLGAIRSASTPDMGLPPPDLQITFGIPAKAPLGGAGTGPNPTDRGKSGTKRSLLTDGCGVPLGVAVAGANRSDMKMVRATLETQVGARPQPTPQAPQNLCLDKGYDFDEVREILAEFGYIPHIRARGEETQAKQHIPGYRARRWVVECTHSWMKRFRRLLIRWEKKVANYLAMLEFACAFIAFRSAKVFG